MKKKLKNIRIKINHQSYIQDIIKKYPSINSGRKNYYKHNIRILKNILLSQVYNRTIKNKEIEYIRNFSFHKNSKFLKIELDA